MAIINKSAHPSMNQPANPAVNQVMRKFKFNLAIRRLVGKALRHRTSIGV